MSTLEAMKAVIGTDTPNMLVILASIYGQDEDKQAIRSFITRNRYHEITEEATEYFIKNYPKNFGLTANNILNGCFSEIKKNEGFYVVNNSELNSEYVFLYKKFQNCLVIHPFEVYNKEWKLITPTKVSIENNSLNIEILSEYTTTPDGNGRTYILPNASDLTSYRDYNLAFFCFISIHCADDYEE